MTAEVRSSARCFITYCSRNKSDAPGKLPAIGRYNSSRIEKAMQVARSQGGSFFILSGEFGLIAPQDPIPWYDHMLLPEEVDSMADRIADQLKQYSDVTFFYKPGDFMAPYLASVKQASDRFGIKVSLVAID